MKIKNRLLLHQPDYVFAIVQKPRHWQPASMDDVPPAGEILESHYVASYEEARDDLLRCNDLALQQNLDQWAVVQNTGGQI